MTSNCIRHPASYTLDESLNKARIVLEMDVEDLRRICTKRTYCRVSKEVFIGRTSFYLFVGPADSNSRRSFKSRNDLMSVFLKNSSCHSVVIDYSIKPLYYGGHQHQECGCKFEQREERGLQNFRPKTKLEGSLKFVVEVTAKSEAIVSGAASNVSGTEGITAGLNKVEVESEDMSNQADSHLEERLDDIHLEERLDDIHLEERNQADIHLEERLEEVETESELEALSIQLVGKEAELHELWNNDRSFIESKGKEMSELLSKLEDAEEEKAAIEKQVAEVDATARELQERREQLVQGIRDKEEKVKKFLKKKNKLEKFIEEQVSESRKAKHQLEKEILEMKGKIEDLSKVDKVDRVEQPESQNLRLKWLESIESRIETEEKELECPVCLEVGRPYFIFLKFAQHLR